MNERNCPPRSWLDFVDEDGDELLRPEVDEDQDEEIEYDDDIRFDDCFGDCFDDGMDGDHASALASAGWGTDEDYGSFFDDSEYADDGEY